MKIEIIGAESLGVRGLCCLVAVGEQKILIDPGIALGFFRNGQSPHPAQVAVGEAIREKIVQAWELATDIVFSHFHGDHVPLVNANPYQLDATRVAALNPGVRIWTKSAEFLSAKERDRFIALKERLDARWQKGERAAGPLRFSAPVPHGKKTNRNEMVMMTRIEDETVFVHTSDIQLLDNDTVDLVLGWQPDILLAGGPPLYLEQLNRELRNRAWLNALRLAESVDTLILDHHLMRSREGLQWVDRLSSESGRRVSCAADFMRVPRRLLEAERKTLYETIPVALGWHQDYAAGKATTEGLPDFIKTIAGKTGQDYNK
jgi:predicted metallo-beta-lactamase superfamily hydrolase